MEIMKLEEKMKSKSVYKVPENEIESQYNNNDIEEDIEEEKHSSEKIDNLSIEDDISEELDFIREENNESPKVLNIFLSTLTKQTFVHFKQEISEEDIVNID